MIVASGARGSRWALALTDSSNCPARHRPSPRSGSTQEYPARYRSRQEGFNLYSLKTRTRRGRGSCLSVATHSLRPAPGRFAAIFSALPRKLRGTTIISFPDFETLGRVITGARVELLNAIRTRRPKSIQELARLVSRDFKNVYNDR